MANGEGTGVAARFIVGVAVLLNLILVVLLIQQVSSVRSEIAQLSDRLASKQDVAMLRPIRVRQILNERCSSCHTERRFAATLEKGPGGSAALVKRMQAHLGADIPDDELAQIESALLVFRCTACHGEGVINRVILMPPRCHRNTRN